jgi:hypothetical protein
MGSISPKSSSDTHSRVRLSIPVAKLLHLFESGGLHAEDFDCLDLQSKNLTKHLLLLACLDAPQSGGDCREPGRALHPRPAPRGGALPIRGDS